MLSNLNKSLKNLNKILEFSLSINSEEEKTEELHQKLDSILKQLKKEKEEQLNKIDEKFKSMLSSIKDKYKQIITEMNEIYDKTEGEIKNTYKGMT